jgi:hypothetical protein
MSLKMKVTAALVGLILTSFMATACSGATDAAGPSAPNSPIATFSVYQGNQCAGSYYVDNAGAEACLIKSHVTTSSVTFQAGAYDYAKDGLSALNESYFYQLVNNSWVQSHHWNFYNSSGYGTTKLQDPVTITKKSGVTKVKIVIKACTYDSPTGVRKSCGTKSWVLNW